MSVRYAVGSMMKLPAIPSMAPGVKFSNLPEAVECLLCGVGKDQFSAE